MATKVLGLILRTDNRKKIQEFYASLGLNFNEHQHGGPVHNECQDIDDNFVLEVYTASKNFPSDALMLSVASVDECLMIIETQGGKVLRPAKDQGMMRFAYISDPDGRPVMLLEQKR